MQPKILLAEDESFLGEIVKESLESRGFKVCFCSDGKQALKVMEGDVPDLLILDVMMPVMDGFEVAKKIRSFDQEIPIIFLTAKSQTQDVVKAFKIGANDYLKKPFSMEELVVRVEALLKKNKVQITQDIYIGKYLFSFNKQTLIFKDHVENLTHREANLLYYLCNKKNEILERGFILKRLWGDDDFFNARSMDVFISKLRKKLQKDESIKILNVRGYGYKLIC